MGVAGKTKITCVPFSGPDIVITRRSGVSPLIEVFDSVGRRSLSPLTGYRVQTERMNI